MKILVALNAPIKNYANIKKHISSNYDLLIAADGAARHLQNISTIPDIIVGDCDSFKTVPKDWKKVKLIKFPKEKDITDGELAIDLGVKKGRRELDLIGLTGGALEHTIANLEVLKRIPSEIDVRVINEAEIIYRITSNAKKEIKTRKGETVSLINVQGNAKITTNGLKYDLSNSKLKTPTHGISNNALGKKINVSLIGKGVVLVFLKI